MATDAAIAALKSSLRGELIQPSDPGYQEARKVYNAMIDKKPRLIARVADVADVITAAKTVRVEGGCTWGDVDHATHAFGYAVPTGIISTTGVGGLALGGGSA